MYAAQVLSTRPFATSDLPIEHSDSVWSGTPEYEARVRAEWKNVQHQTTSHAWDGTYYRILDPTVLENGSGPILLGTVAYRYIATFPSLFQEHSRLALEPLNHLSTASLIRTTDNLYLFGVRSRNGSIDLIGGGVQSDEIEVLRGADLEKNIYKEIREETGLDHEDVESVMGIGTVISTTSNVLIISHAQLTLTSREVINKFEQRTDDEMERLIFVDGENVRGFLMEMSDYRNLLVQLDW